MYLDAWVPVCIFVANKREHEVRLSGKSYGRKYDGNPDGQLMELTAPRLPGLRDDPTSIDSARAADARFVILPQ